MSRIPNNAIPHAGPAPEAETDTGTETASPTLSQRAAGLADLVRDHPKTAIAAGAVLAAGAAAAIPLARARTRSRADGSDTGGSSGGGKSKKN